MICGDNGLCGSGTHFLHIVTHELDNRIERNGFLRLVNIN